MGSVLDAKGGRVSALGSSNCAEDDDKELAVKEETG